MSHPESSFRMAHVILGSLYSIKESLSRAKGCSAPQIFVDMNQYMVIEVQRTETTAIATFQYHGALHLTITMR